MATRWRSPPDNVDGRRSRGGRYRAHPHRIEADHAPCGLREPAPVAQIGPDGEMRQQLRILKHQPHAPPMRRHRDRAAVSSKVSSCQAILPRSGVSRPARSRTAVDFPAPRRPDQRGHAGTGLERRIECEARPGERAGEADHAGPPSRRPMRRARNSEGDQRQHAMTTATSDRRKAPASPPGICVRL